jgi:hypothetical protein
MSRQYWQELIWWATADASPVANTTSEALLFPNVTIPGNYLGDGRVIRVTAYGKLSTTGTPTIQFSLRIGGLAGTLLWQSEALTMGSGVANVNFEIELLIQTRTNGSSGKLLVMGDVAINTSSSAAIEQVVGVSGYDAPAEVTVDLTADAALSLTAKWSAASASNTVTGMMYYGESLN